MGLFCGEAEVSRDGPNLLGPHAEAVIVPNRSSQVSKGYVLVEVEWPGAAPVLVLRRQASNQGTEHQAFGLSRLGILQRQGLCLQPVPDQRPEACVSTGHGSRDKGPVSVEHAARNLWVAAGWLAAVML